MFYLLLIFRIMLSNEFEINTAKTISGLTVDVVKQVESIKKQRDQINKENRIIEDQLKEIGAVCEPFSLTYSLAPDYLRSSIEKLTCKKIKAGDVFTTELLLSVKKCKPEDFYFSFKKVVNKSKNLCTQIKSYNVMLSEYLKQVTLFGDAALQIYGDYANSQIEEEIENKPEPKCIEYCDKLPEPELCKCEVCKLGCKEVVEKEEEEYKAYALETNQADVYEPKTKEEIEARELSENTLSDARSAYAAPKMSSGALTLSKSKDVSNPRPKPKNRLIGVNRDSHVATMSNGIQYTKGSFTNSVNKDKESKKLPSVKIRKNTAKKVKIKSQKSSEVQEMPQNDIIGIDPFPKLKLKKKVRQLQDFTARESDTIMSWVILIPLILLIIYGIIRVSRRIEK